jgi:hypothetical protein
VLLAAGRGLALAAAVAAGVAGCRRATPPAPTAAGPLWRGVALGLFGEDPDWSYDGLLGEIQALGATHLLLVIPYYQRAATTTEIGPHTRFSPPDRTVLRALRQAQARGLRVVLFPIVRLEDAGPKGTDWRGNLRPADRDAWLASYGRWLAALADLARREGVFGLSVGSELSSLDVERAPWERLIRDVRGRFAGVLTYSGNWDHFDQVSFWDLVDVVGVTGYFELKSKDGATDVGALTRAWREHRRKLEAWQARVGRPLVFTELGYLSQRGTHAWPWNEGATQPVDLDEQRRCYQAFIGAWDGSAALRGVFVWNWYGWGGPRSRGYTPRGKPAAEVIERWFKGLVVRQAP